MSFNFFKKDDTPEPAQAPEQTNNVASAQEVSPAVDPNKAADVARFEKLFPSFVGCYDALSPDMRSRMLYDKIEATSTPVTPTEAEDDGAPKIRPVPALNMEMANARLAQAIEGQDSEEIVAAQKAITDHQEQLMAVVNDYNILNDYNTQKMQKQILLMQRPAEIRAAGTAVTGFEEADVAVAAQLLDSGDIQDLGTAVKYAVHQRLVASNSAVPPTAAEEAVRQASAAVAASAPGGTETAGPDEVIATESFTDPKFTDALHQAAAANKQTQT